MGEPERMRGGARTRTLLHPQWREVGCSQELTLEEAMAIAGKKPQDWTKATDEELMVGAFGEGIPGMVSHSTETIVVKLDDEKTQMPFGFAETAPLLELLWRKTGADCAGEEADLDLASGTYHILLQE